MNTIKTLLKTFLAGLMALAILSVLMLGYYFKPLRENNPQKNTDYVWAENTPWFDSNEGVSFGVTDAKGFINQKVIDDPDIFLLGSSHAESMNVAQNENMCALLNDKFSGKYSAYNMGISGHTFYKVLQYLKNSLSIYEKTPKYVIIETSSVALNEAEVQQALTGNVKKTEVVDTGLIYQMQKVPYLREMYHQLDGGMLKMLMDKNNKSSSSTLSDKSITNKSVVVDEKAFQQTFEYLQQIEKDYGTKIIVMFHPVENLNADGSISFAEKEYAEAFSDYAKKYDVGFVDLTKDFEKMYYEQNHVPHGFATGELGAGHLNKYGHAAIAESLYRYINEMEVK